MPEYDIALELARLHILTGADFVRQLKILAQYNIFKPVDNEKDIYAAEGSHRDDFPSLLDAHNGSCDALFPAVDRKYEKEIPQAFYRRRLCQTPPDNMP